MHQIHDKGYKRLFRNKAIFRQLLETFVPEPWVKELDFDSSECLEKSFISEHYKETISDIIYKIRLKQRDAYIIILMEFKSTAERFASLDIAHYVTGFYKDIVASNKAMKQLPPVFPILLYNGDKRWTAPTNLADLIELHDNLGKFAPNFEYFKIAINEYSKEDLLKIKNAVSLLFLAEAHYDAELLERTFLEVFDRDADKKPVSLLINWLAQLSKHGRIPVEDYDKLEHIYEDKEEVQIMLISALKKEKQEYFQRGKLEGKLEGRTEQQLEVARKMIIKGFEIALITELSGLSEEEIHKLKQELAGQRNT